MMPTSLLQELTSLILIILSVNIIGYPKQEENSGNMLLILYQKARRETINVIQSRQQRDVHQYGRYNIEPGLQGTVDDPATFSIRLISAVQIHGPLQIKEDVPSSKTFHTSECKSTVSSSDLSKRWIIGLKQATQTIKSTSQCLLTSAILPLA